MPTIAQAQYWLDRWDRQQEFYIADREERFSVIGDVVAGVEQVGALRILDLGCGPGSLSVRLLDRFPGAQVTAVDADPLLLGLARVAFGDRPGLRIVSADLRDPAWVGQVDAPFDAIVSTTALHWLTRDELAAVYAAAGSLVRPGGVLVDGDHFAEPAGRPRLDELARRVADARAERVADARAEQVAADHTEDWRQWWQAVGAAPELAELAGERGARPIDHTVPDVPTVDDHADLLAAAGFGEVGTVWQHGNDRVLVAVR